MSKTLGRPIDPEIEAHVEAFKRLNPGDSFFVQGAQRADLDFLRKPFIRAGTPAVMRRVEHDTIYGTPGVRVWRLEGSYDEL